MALLLLPAALDIFTEADWKTYIFLAISADFLWPNQLIPNILRFVGSSPTNTFHILHGLLAGYVDALYITKDYNRAHRVYRAFIGSLLIRQLISWSWRTSKSVVHYALSHILILLTYGICLLTLWRFTSSSWRRRTHDLLESIVVRAILLPSNLLYGVGCISSILAEALRSATIKSPSTTNFSYSYAPEFDPSNQIRLLKLQRKLPFIELSGELLSHTFHDAPPFHAISYAWASGTQSMRPMTLNGKKHRVTGSVYGILLRCSSFFKPQLVWIDTICIDQTNLDEKILQVRAMREIYGRAAHVLVCLGEGPASYALSMVRELNSRYRTFGEEHVVGHVAAFVERRRTDLLLRARVKAMLGLLQHVWFQRVWVVQEVVVARQVTVCYGQECIPWPDFFDRVHWVATGQLLSWFSLLEDTKSTAYPARLKIMLSSFIGFMSLPLISGCRIDYGEQGPQRLSHLLRIFGEREATNPIDKVFALAGLAQYNINLDQLIDYHREPGDVLLDLANFLLDNGEVLEVLDLAGIGQEGRHSSLPSWAVDWTAIRLGASLSSTYAPSNVRYSATKDKPPTVSRGNDRKHLVVRGQFVDKIFSLAPAMELPLGQESEISKFPNMALYLDHSYELARKHVRDPYPYPHLGNQPLEEAVWRTLIGDKTFSDRPAPSSYGQVLRSTLRLMQDVVQLYEEHGPRIFEIPPPEDLQSQLGSQLGPNPREKLQNIFQMLESVNFLCDSGKGSNTYTFCTTERGYIGMVPQRSQTGDSIHLIFGLETPYVLRPLCEEGGEQSPERFELVGASYVHGIMDGEALDLEYADEDFVLA
jgi:hypothetical protein